MSSKGWKNFIFSDFVLINPSTSLESSNEYSFIEMKDLNEKYKYVYPSALKKLTGGARFKERDTLFARITPCLENGKICQVKQLRNGIGFGSTEFLVFRGIDGISDTDFVYYLSRSNEVRNFAEKNMHGTSGRQRVTWEAFNNLHLNLPTLPTQRRIANILSALDDKIELNRQTNATLEAIAQTIFKEWFVENEKAYEWDLAPLPEVIEINPPRSLKVNQIAPYLDMASMPTTGHRVNGWVNRPFGSGTKFINGDTLIAKITPCLENGKTAFVDFLENGKIGWGSTEYIIFRPKPPIPPEYGYFLARSDEIRNYGIQNMIGTSGRQRVPVTCFNFLSIRLPPTDLVIQFGIIAESLMKQIKANSEESMTFTFIRDILIPKLMSGEIQVINGEI